MGVELTERLKKRHLELFERKREFFREELRKNYREFLSEKTGTTEAKALRYSEFYLRLAEKWKYEVYPEERLVGTGWHFLWAEDPGLPDPPGNGGHFMADFGSFTREGVSGIRERIDQIPENDDRSRENKAAFRASLEAFRLYCLGYAAAAASAADEADAAEAERWRAVAEDCRRVAEKPPETFRQALQLVTFLQFFLQIEASAAAVSLGRLDVLLYPFCARDLAEGRLTREDAKTLIRCFYIKLSEGDESQMLTVGGPEENELSRIMVEAQEEIHMRQPSIGLRVCAATSPELMEAAAKLTLRGSGMPAYFNDDVILPGLRSIGIDAQSAADYGIVGCYEAAPQGSWSNTVAAQLYLYEAFDAFVRDNETEYGSYEAFYGAFKAAFAAYYERVWLPRLRDSLARKRATASPFASVCMKGCIARGRLCEEGGSDYFLLGTNMLGIGLVIESLFAVKKLVFERKALALRELVRAAENNFADGEIYGKVCALQESFGSDSPESNRVAEEFSVFLREVVDAYPVDEAVRVSPALFRFAADIWQRGAPATLSGRKRGELLSYGIAPCASPHHFPILSVLSASGHVACDRFPNGCPMLISLSRGDAEAPGVLAAIVKAYFQKGGFNLAINLTDPATLEAAKAEPESYPDVMVKISGFSTQFVGLREEIQSAVIERAKRGV